jgi:hypothetical protein
VPQKGDRVFYSFDTGDSVGVVIRSRASSKKAPATSGRGRGRGRGKPKRDPNSGWYDVTFDDDGAKLCVLMEVKNKWKVWKFEDDVLAAAVTDTAARPRRAKKKKPAEFEEKKPVGRRKGKPTAKRNSRSFRCTSSSQQKKNKGRQHFYDSSMSKKERALVRIHAILQFALFSFCASYL